MRELERIRRGNAFRLSHFLHDPGDPKAHMDRAVLKVTS